VPDRGQVFGRTSLIGAPRTTTIFRWQFSRQQQCCHIAVSDYVGQRTAPGSDVDNLRECNAGSWITFDTQQVLPSHELVFE
jgi:hypothetical protein